MKDHLIFIGKVAAGVIVGIIVMDFVKKQMAAKTKTAEVVYTAPVSPVMVTETANA